MEPRLIILLLQEMLEESVEKAEAGARELKQRAPSQKSPTAALYQASVAESPDALPPENQGSIRHGSAIPTTTAAVH